MGATEAFHSPSFTQMTAAKLRPKPSFSKISLSAAQVSTNPDLQPGIAAIDAQNHDFYKHLHKLREQPSFSLYSVDMLASCEYMPQELFECYSETCEIYPVDDDEVSDKLVVICL